MKITHNKVGQNLNTVDGAKTDASKKSGKNSAASSIATTGLGPNLNPISRDGDATKVDLSPRAQEAKRIKELAMAAPDIDTEKVARFQKMIDEGKYKVDSKAVADRMVDEHLETAE